MFGLKDSDVQYIKTVLLSYPEIEEAILFGSRAMGRSKKGSDVDIALKGKELDKLIAEISGKLNDESPLPYFIDVLDYNLIDNDNLKEHIDRAGQTL